MEGEGSGYDLMYETLLTAGKSRPVVYEGSDFVKVVINRKISNKEIVQLCDFVISNYPTTQKGRIALGLILNEKKLTAAEMAKRLQLQTDDKLDNYIRKLVDEGIVSFTGRGKGTQYFISPQVIKFSKSNVITSLKTIEPYRLRALIKEDLRFHPDSLWSEIAVRLPDVNTDELQRTIRKMTIDGEISGSASRKYRRYRLP